MAHNNFTYQVDSTDLKFATTLGICVEFPLAQLGNLLLLSIIHYEHFGADPMKRSLANKLVSAMCFSIIYAQLSSSMTLMLRVIFGGLGLPVAHFLVLIQISGVLLIGMNIMGIFTFKSIQLIAFNFSNRMDEGFWFWSYEIFSLTLSFILTLLEAAVGERPMPLAQVMAGNHPWVSKSMVRILFGYLISGSFLSLLVYTGLSIWKKSKNSTFEPQSPQQNNGFNVLAHNPRILNDFQFLFVASINVISAIFPILMTGGKPPDTSDELIMLWMPMRICVGMIGPIMFFLFNRDLRHYCKREFWDIAPEWLQDYNPNLISLGENESTKRHDNIEQEEIIVT